MTSEGSREIEAARKRLTAAKTQASAASKHKEMIAKLMESANSMLDTAEKEVTEAEAMLKDAEKRWEVIHIDDIDSPKKKDGGSNKRRKVSLSPQGGNNNTASVSIVQPNSFNGNSSVNNSGRATSSATESTSALSATTSSSISNIEQIAVEGCGISDVNGTYHKSLGNYNGAPVYIKHGTNSRGRVYAIYRSLIVSERWYIGNWDAVTGVPSAGMFYRNNSSYCCTPPEDGWVAAYSGEEPAPTCRRLRNSTESVAMERVRRMQGLSNSAGNMYSSIAVGHSNGSSTNTTSSLASGTEQSATYTYETVKLSFEPGRKLGFVLVDSLVDPPSDNQDMSSNNSRTVVTISRNSIIFLFADILLKAANQRMRALVNPSNLEELIAWGRKELPPLQFGNGSVSFDTMNGESMKCVLDCTIRPGDIVEKVQYTCPTQLTTATFHGPAIKSRDLAAVLRVTQNYPISMTLKRPTVNEVVVEMQEQLSSMVHTNEMVRGMGFHVS